VVDPSSRKSRRTRCTVFSLNQKGSQGSGGIRYICGPYGANHGGPNVSMILPPGFRAETISAKFFSGSGKCSKAFSESTTSNCLPPISVSAEAFASPESLLLTCSILSGARSTPCAWEAPSLPRLLFDSHCRIRNRGPSCRGQDHRSWGLQGATCTGDRRPPTLRWSRHSHRRRSDRSARGRTAGAGVRRLSADQGCDALLSNGFHLATEPNPAPKPPAPQRPFGPYSNSPQSITTALGAD
jgi:hypothetical protein